MSEATWRKVVRHLVQPARILILNPDEAYKGRRIMTKLIQVLRISSGRLITFEKMKSRLTHPNHVQKLAHRTVLIPLQSVDEKDPYLQLAMMEGKSRSMNIILIGQTFTDVPEAYRNRFDLIIARRPAETIGEVVVGLPKHCLLAAVKLWGLEPTIVKMRFTKREEPLA